MTPYAVHKSVRPLRARVAEFAVRLRRAWSPSDILTQRIRAQQVDLLFKNVGPGVVGAGLVNLALAIVLTHLGAVETARGLLWVVYILMCMTVHLGLLYLYQKRTDTTHWRSWAAATSLVSLVEGLGWGWAPVYLLNANGEEFRLLVACATMIVATAAAPAFGSYLPAFFAFFIPASLPFAIASWFEPEPAVRVAAFIMPVFMLTVPVLAIQASDKLRELVTLRLKSSELAERLRSQIELVEQAMIAKSNFLAAASHDLRQPVHAIGLFAGALRELALPEAGRRLTNQIENSVVALDGLFAALLDISRLDANSVEVRRSSFAIQSLLARIHQDFAVESSAKSIEFRWVASGVRVYSDPILLERIVRNLVSNAVRYTPRGRVLVGCRRRGSAIELQVCDTGPGIAPEHRDLIFKEYFQLHNSERDRQKGLGLGLAIVQRLVTLLNYQLHLRSELGRGSCFSLRIPISEAEKPREAPASERTAFARENGLIAVVDDEAPILTGITALLEGWGYVVVSGGSSEELVGKLAQSPSLPDLIISDYWLREGETGLDVIDRLRAEFNEDIPAILISGDTGAQLRSEAQAVGAVLMHKPTPNGKLRAAISHALAAGRLRASEQHTVG